MSAQTLDALWTRLRLELVLLADGGTMNYNGNQISESKDPSKPPPRAGDDLRHFEGRWGLAAGDRAKRAMLLCRDCQDNGDLAKAPGGAVRCCVIGALRSYRLANPPATNPGTKEWRQAIAKDPRPSRIVARMYGVSHNAVCSYRRQHGQPEED